MLAYNSGVVLRGLVFTVSVGTRIPSTNNRASCWNDEALPVLYL
jgi:hypothetical protein